jgi:signal recognition particle receptor subunit beta
MVFLNQTTMQMTAKIVYYGPGLCGKTTNLQWIHAKTAPRSRGEMVSLETEADRTLFFDLLPLDVGVIGGMKVRLQLYTVPGQVFYNATRRLVLKGVDGVVFVADSQMAAHEANAEALANLRANLEELGLRFDDIPVVFQYNKRDLNQIQSLDVMRRELNPGGAPDFEAAALHGVGVFETLKTVSRVALSAVRTRVAEENRREPAPPGKVVRPAPPEASSPPPAMPEPKAAASPVAHSLSELVPDPSSIAEVKVEFAEEVTGKFEVRPVATLDRTDLEQELEKLRAAAGRAKASAIASREMDRLVAGLLDGGKGTRQEVKRKATVEVPEKALRGATGFRLNVVLEKDGRDEVVENVLLVKLVGNTRQLDRLNLKLDLDLKGR